MHVSRAGDQDIRDLHASRAHWSSVAASQQCEDAETLVSEWSIMQDWASSRMACLLQKITVVSMQLESGPPPNQTE